MNTISYPVGYRQFHADPSINYQLNRWLPGAMEAEFLEAAHRLRTLADWKTVMLGLAEKALQDGRILHASTYFRAAEFFIDETDPQRMLAYDNYVRLFRKAFRAVPHALHEIPFAGRWLSAVRFQAPGQPRDTVIIHGGFDSCYEEFWFWGPHFAARGYDVILFEGPGQGAPLRKHGLTLRHDWEVPTAAVLEHFEIRSCTLIGISLGGLLAMRAAAFEPRIRRVVALDVMFDRFDCFSMASGSDKSEAIKRLVSIGARDKVESLMQQAMASSESTAWAIRQGLWTSGCRTVYDYVCWIMRFSAESFSSRITQDVLLLAGSRDHMVPRRQFFQQGEALVNVHSLQMRMFTEHESAQAHCQVGNIGLLLRHLEDWLAAVTTESHGNAPGASLRSRWEEA